MSEVKSFHGEIKAAGAGTLVATFARFDAVDADGDVTLKTAIPDGIEVPFGSWNHSSGFSGTQLPIGKGVIRNDGTRAQFVATIFDTPDAQAEFAVIKGLGKLAEWSYTLRPLEVSTDARELEPYGPKARRILKALDVIEVCAVIRGAGIDTRTDSAKRGVQFFSDVGITPSFLWQTAQRLRSLEHPPLTLAELGIDKEFADRLQHERIARFMNEEAR